MESLEKKYFGLFGTGGYAREVMPIADQQLKAMGFTEIVFVQTVPDREEVNGFRVVSEEAFVNLSGEKFFNIAIAESNIREQIAGRMKSKGIKPISLTANNATIYQNNSIGEGVIMCAQTIVTSNAQIGDFFHANIYSYVAHDCIIGNFVTFAPNVHCNGNVTIGDHAYIGTGAIIKQGTPDKPVVIGEGAIVGMGSVVTKSVPANSTVIGCPARVIER